jgi:hypothetical protein
MSGDTDTLEVEAEAFDTGSRAPAPPVIPPTRDQIREAIFNAKPNRTPITLFGMKLELVEPPLSIVLAAQQNEDRSMAVAEMIVRYTYMPGTQVQVFEDADLNAILALPFGKDLAGLNAAITEMMGVTPDDADKSGAEG